jgi:methyl-accepting chemotaxis protein
MKNLRLRNRILLGYAPPLCLFIILGGIVYFAVVYKAKLQKEVEIAQETILEADRTILGLSKMVRAVRGQVIHPEDASYQKTFAGGLAVFQEASQKLDQVVQEPQQQERLNKILSEANQLIEISDQVFEQVKANQLDEAIALTDKLRLVEIDQLHQEMLDKEVVLLNEKANQEEAAGNFLILSVVLGTAIAAASTALTGLLIASNINQTLQQSAIHITASSSEIATMMEEQERITSQQSSSVNETTTTMDELEASFRQSAEQAKAALAAAQQVLQLTECGTQAVKKNLAGMSSLEKKAEVVSEQMLQLSECAHQVGSISQIVSELAGQTNMLALNSSVEAARAGEHGKGFTTIANEIRKLADRSQKSIGKINELVSQIQTAVNSTVMVTKENTKTAKLGVQTAQETEQVFAGVGDAVDKVVLNNQQISLNLKQQLNGVQQVVQAMSAVNTGAKETASSISQAKTGTHQLNVEALKLQQLV